MIGTLITGLVYLIACSGVALLLPREKAVRMFDFLHRSGLSLPGLLIAWALFNRIFSPILRAALGFLYSGA